MEKIFYITEAYISTYSQGTDLQIVKSPDGNLYGVSCEFELCTQDIAKVSVPINGVFNDNEISYYNAKWLNYSNDIGTSPASYEDIINADLTSFVVGYQLESELKVHRFKKELHKK